MEKTLHLFSYIFHPLFISVYAVLLFFVFGDSFFEYPEIYLMLIQIVIITILIPLTFYYLLLSLGKVDSIMLSTPTQRKIPLIIHAVLLIILLRRTIPLKVYPELHFFFLGSLISTCLALALIFFGVKASLHMIGIAALTIFAIGMSMHFHQRLVVVIIVLLLCNGFVASSRLSMKAHSRNELIAGTMIGVIPQLGLLYLWL